MRASARVRANRLNAKRITGPKSKEGKERSALNALKHGLSIPVGMVPECSPTVKAHISHLTHEKAPESIREAARIFAEAQADIDRVRQVRRALYEDGDARTKKIPTGQKLKTAIAILDLVEKIDALPDTSPLPEFRDALPAVAEFLRTFKLKPETPTLEAGMRTLAPQLAKLWRYERLALSRRDKAGEQLRVLYSIYNDQNNSEL